MLGKAVARTVAVRLPGMLLAIRVLRAACANTSVLGATGHSLTNAVWLHGASDTLKSDAAHVEFANAIQLICSRYAEGCSLARARLPSARLSLAHRVFEERTHGRHRCGIAREHRDPRTTGPADALLAATARRVWHAIVSKCAEKSIQDRLRSVRILPHRGQIPDDGDNVSVSDTVPRIKPFYDVRAKAGACPGVGCFCFCLLEYS